MKIDELIKNLLELRAQEGNKEIVISSDPEGNNYWSLDKNYMFGLNNKTLILYPTTPIYLEEFSK